MPVSEERAREILGIKEPGAIMAGPKEGPKMLTGTISKKIVEGDRVALQIGGTWYSQFKTSERIDDVTRDILEQCQVGHEVQFDVYENRGYKNIGALLWVTREGEAPGEVPKPTAPAPSADKPKWTPRAGGGGGGYKGYPPAEVEKAKYASFSTSYAKDLTVALVAQGAFPVPEAAIAFLEDAAKRVHKILTGLA